MPQTALEDTESNESVIDAPQQEESSEFEIEIVDDTPEEDQGREAMPEEMGPTGHPQGVCWVKPKVSQIKKSLE